MFKKIFLGMVLGIIISTVLLQYDYDLQQKIYQAYRYEFERSLHCHMYAEVHALNLFKPSLHLHNMEVIPTEQKVSWCWRCDSFITGFSWLSLLLYGSIDMNIHIDRCVSESELCDKKLAIHDHIECLFKRVSLPLALYTRHMTVRRAQTRIHDEHNKTVATYGWDLISKRYPGLVRSHIQIFDGAITHPQFSPVSNIYGTCMIDSAQTGCGSVYTIVPDLCAVVDAWEGAGPCYITGTWSEYYGKFSLRNAERSFAIEPIVALTPKGEWVIRMQGTFPIEYIMPYIPGIQVPTTTGICSFKTQAKYREKQISFDGHTILENITLKTYVQGMTLKAFFTGQDFVCKGNVGLRLSNHVDLEAAWEWDIKQQHAALSVWNQTEVNIPTYPAIRLPSRDGLLTMRYDYTSGMIATLSCRAMQHTNVLPPMSAELVYDPNKRYTITGKYDEYRLCVEGTTQFPYVRALTILLRDAPLCELNQLAANQLTGKIYLEQLRNTCKRFCNHIPSAAGSINIFCDVATSAGSAKVEFGQGTIVRLANTHNFIDECTARMYWNLPQYKLVITDFFAHLHEGTISCPRAVIHYQKPNMHIHAPFLLDRCLVNSAQEFFAIISGSIIARDTGINAQLIIDRSQLKENIFSRQLQERFFKESYDVPIPYQHIPYTITVATKEPMRIDTPFMKTNARIALEVVNTNDKKMQLGGTVKLVGGSLLFPYKPLFIRNGLLTLNPQHPFDPYVELYAQNKIKQHDISLQVYGSLQQHQIALNATPPLSEEQIISLLLVGSYDQLLTAMIPTLIVQNLPNLIFGSNHAHFIDRYFKPLIKPVSINLVPSFADQSGRGGLRGGVEVTINDRLRAVLQKNFSLTEDTRFELEYLVSDDVTVRAVRDERRDIGAEIEMKWKF